MYNTKEKLNNVGVVAGILLTLIPFYYVINYISSLGTLKKTRVFVLSIFTFIVLVSYFILSMVITFKIMETTFDTLMADDAYYYFNYDSYSIIMEEIRVSMFIMLLASIPVYALTIVTGCLTYNFLKSGESDFLTNDERFRLAKFAGINLMFIPFYYIIKLGMEMDLIKSVDESKGGLIVAFFVLSGCTIFLSLVPIIGGLLATGFYIVGIILAVQLNNLKDTIIVVGDDKYKEEYDNFVSF